MPCEQRFLSSMAVGIYEAVPSSVLESFRFKDENYENEIFSILSGARARTNVILAGKGVLARKS